MREDIIFSPGSKTASLYGYSGSLGKEGTNFRIPAHKGSPTF